MTKNVLILHDTASGPSANWLPWLKNQLLWRGYEVVAPELPEATQPNFNRYWEVLKVYPFDENTVIVGHGSGAAAAFACLNKFSVDLQVRSVVSVAGFCIEDGDGDGDESNEGLLLSQLSWSKIKQRAKNISVLWSRDDPLVSMQQTELLAEYLNVEPIIFEDCGHFDLEAGSRFSQFPQLLGLILSQ